MQQIIPSASLEELRSEADFHFCRQGKRSRLSKIIIGTALIASFGLFSVMAEAATCPTSRGKAPIIFSDGSILMSTALAVNPDGAVASYTHGDHGYTYINNGVNLIGSHGEQLSCGVAANQCREKWSRAERGMFGAGTPEFCVFAMEVEPVLSDAKIVSCDTPPRGRAIVGNGKGRPRHGVSVSDVSGASVSTYSSTTTLQHTRDHKSVYVDSATIPGLVAPTTRPDLVGAIAWVRYRGHEGFAIVNDTGPRFGEGSVALHQLLQSGEVGPLQPIGPIPINLRCSAVETGLKPPFISKPDQGDADKCRAGIPARGKADIRAYRGIDRGVISIILAKVKLPMRGRVVTEELTPDRIKEWARAQGFTSEKLNSMAKCLPL